MFEKPVVGARLGVTVAGLFERMNAYRPDTEENEDDILAYLDGQGYTDFRECPDHALAVLHFAEKFRYRDLWVDAFVHCVGMNSTLVNSLELDTVSRTTKALITRSRLEMDLRIDHADDCLGTFLEEELSGKYLGLPNEALGHLERFRSFLHSFYVQQYGYWPPTQPKKRTNALSRSVLRSMYFDFRSLYDYLVDTSSSCSLQDLTATNGGICTLQNIIAFDRRYKLTSLPHPLPLIPDASTPSFGSRPSTFARLFNSKRIKMEKKMASLSALAASTNCEDSTVMESALVRQYFRFEREWAIKDDEKISSPEARKVRWILIYAMLQTLISVTRAPIEVRDTEGVSYPLCCQTAGTPPWKTDGVDASSSNLTLQAFASTTVSTANTSTLELRPDTDCLTPAIINATRRTLFSLSTTSSSALPMVPAQPVSPLTASSTYTTRTCTPNTIKSDSKSRSRKTSISSIATAITTRHTPRKSKSFGDLPPPTPSTPIEPVPKLPHLDIKAPQPRRASAHIFVGNCDNSTCHLPSPTRTAPLSASESQSPCSSTSSLPSPTRAAPPPPPHPQSPSPSLSAHSSSTSGDWSAKDASSDDGIDMDHHSLCSETASDHKQTKSLSPPPLQIKKPTAKPPPLVLKRNPTQEELPSRRPMSSCTATSADLPDLGLSQTALYASLLACEPNSYAPVPLTASNALNSHPVSKSSRGGGGGATAPASTRSRSPAPSVSSTIRAKGRKLRSKFSMDSLRGREGRNPEVGEYLRGMSRMSTRDVGDEWGRF